jgi:hypothetical protein
MFFSLKDAKFIAIHAFVSLMYFIILVLIIQVDEVGVDVNGVQFINGL